MSDELDPCDLHEETVSVLMAGVRTTAERMKSRLPAHVGVNDVVNAGYIALTQALAYWQEDSEDSLEGYAMKRASAAMVATLRGPNHPELPDLDESASASVGTWDTIVSPPCLSDKPERRSGVESRDLAMEEIGVRVA